MMPGPPPPSALPWIIDGIALLLILGTALAGLAKGAIKVLGSIAGFVGALLVAWHFAPYVALIFKPKVDSEFFAAALAFLAIFVVAMILVAIIVYLLTKLFDAILLGWLNKLLGFLAGLLIGIFVVMFLLWVILEISPGMRSTFLETRLVRVLVWILYLVTTGKTPVPGGIFSPAPV